jgi:hypothetical protein
VAINLLVYRQNWDAISFGKITFSDRITTNDMSTTGSPVDLYVTFWFDI